MLHGESGSGKTSAMVCCATSEGELTADMTSGTLVLMLLASDVAEKLSHVATDASPQIIADAFTKAFFQIAVEHIDKLAVTLSRPDIDEAKRQLTVVFAFDEASTVPTFVRMLCRTRVQLRNNCNGA